MSKRNKTGLQPVSRPMERVHYLGGGVGVQSPFDAIKELITKHPSDASELIKASCHGFRFA